MNFWTPLLNTTGYAKKVSSKASKNSQRRTPRFKNTRTNSKDSHRSKSR